MELWYSEFHTGNVKLSVRVDRQLFSGESEYQRIDVFESAEFGKFVALDGEIVFSEKDEFIYDEIGDHVPMAVHPKCEKCADHWRRGRRCGKGVDPVSGN